MRTLLLSGWPDALWISQLHLHSLCMACTLTTCCKCITAFVNTDVTVELCLSMLLLWCFSTSLCAFGTFIFSCMHLIPWQNTQSNIGSFFFLCANKQKEKTKACMHLSQISSRHVPKLKRDCASCSMYSLTNQLACSDFLSIEFLGLLIQNVV